MGAVENVATTIRRALAIPLSLSFPPPSPFFSPTLSFSVLSNRSRAERANAGGKGKKGRGVARHIFMREERGQNGRAMNSGKFPSDLAQLIRIRPNRPRVHLFLINRAHTVTSHPQMLRRIRPQRRQAPFRLPEEPPQKAHPPSPADGKAISPTRFLSD